MAFDVIIANGMVIDGTGRLRYEADIAVSGGKIAAIGGLERAEAERVIDATGLVVAPGFIDMHTHSDLSLLDDPRGDSKVHQGITTEVAGNCAYSPFPVGPDGPESLRRSMRQAFEWDWTDLDGWASHLESNGIGVNVAPQVGHGSVRKAVGLTSDRRPTADELGSMRRLVAESVEQGAFGMSTGLTTAPSMYGDTDEVVALAEAMTPYEGAYYVTHARVWGGNHIGAIEEAMEIGRRAGVPVQFSHMAIIDSRHYGEGEEMVGIIERARSEGLDATYDVYPYTAAGSGLMQSLPFWLQEGGEEAMLRRMRTPGGRDRALADMRKGHFGDLPWKFDAVVISYVGSEANRDIVGKECRADRLGA